ncbi:MAG: protein-L-isoaspartate(D-aspartate) O-methyltransferase [Methylococcales bacterium]|nr:protein-L-isoaspartate(D-aspartate) O-methyltransferase [Methylococcales bacterium]
MTSSRTRSRMVERLKNQGIIDLDVLNAIQNTPRHIFVDEALASHAYEDTSLPIGYNQTISQPYIVARMTELLLSQNSLSKVLEIGTGCGYQSAVLSQLIDQIYSVERIGALLKKAKDNLWDLKLKNIKFQHADGGWGWPEYAAYDGIIVAAAPLEVPTILLSQLRVGGVMVIPIGSKNKQTLHKIVRTEKGFDEKILDVVSFVPFLSGRN